MKDKIMFLNYEVKRDEVKEFLDFLEMCVGFRENEKEFYKLFEE